MHEPILRFGDDHLGVDDPDKLQRHYDDEQHCEAVASTSELVIQDQRGFLPISQPIHPSLKQQI
jgi:hypothetical protein